MHRENVERRVWVEGLGLEEILDFCSWQGVG